MKKCNKKWLSGLCVIATLSLVFSVAKPMNKTNADTGGGGVATHGGVVSGGHSVSSGSYASVSLMGYRLYFAENTLSEPSMTFDQSTYNSLTKYVPLSVYTFRNWSGGGIYDGASDGMIHTWTPYEGIQSQYIAKEDDFNEVFGHVFGQSSSNLPAVDLSASIQTGNDFQPFIDYCNPIKNDPYGLKTAFDGFISYNAGNSSYTASQQELYDELKTKNIDELMLVAEPVFICQSPADGNLLYTISLSDFGDDGYVSGWGGGLYEQGAMVASRITTKLNQLYTDFTYKDQQVNATNRWYGFFIYNFMNSLSEDKLGIGINLNLQYTEDIKKNNSTSDNINTSLSETMTAPSSQNPDSSSFVGDKKYNLGLQSWNGLIDSGSSAGHSYSALYMSGWGFNNTAYNGNRAIGGMLDALPWTGAWKYQAIDNLRETVDTSMKSRIDGTTSDYMLGVFGHMKSNAVDAIADEDLFITNNSTVKLTLEKGTTGDYSMFYGNADAMNQVNDYVQENAKAVTKETPLNPIDSGLAFGSSFRTAFWLNSPDLGSELGHKLQGAFNNSGLYISDVNSGYSMDAEADTDGNVKYQKTPDEVKEALSTIQGATVFANPITYTEAGDASHATVTGGEITVSINSMEKRHKVSNYLCATRVIATGGENSPVKYNLAETGRDYTNEHVVQTGTQWYINDVSTGTIGSAGDDAVTFLLVWKNSDMTKDKYSFASGVSDGATAITEDLAEYMTESNQNMGDTKSYSAISSSFQHLTGVAPLSVTCLGDDSTIDTNIVLGSYFGSDDSITGLSALVLTVGGGGNMYIETGGNLPADMLNIIAPSSWGLTSTQAPYSNSYSKRDWDGTERDWSVTDQFSGDLHNFSGTDLLYYNEETGNFGSPEDEEKWFDYGEKAYMSYAYILPRSAWGDLPTVADYLGDGLDNDYTDFAERMKFPVGDYAENGITCNVGSNVERIYPDALHDIHRFKCYVEWETRRKDWNSDHTDWSWDYTTRHSSTTKTYSITSTMDKYTAMDRGISSLSSNEANTLYWDNNDYARDTEFSYASSIRNQSEDTIYLYPEVKMLMQYANGDTIGSTDDVETVDNLYVMGEKLRSFKPLAMRGIMVGNQEQFEGDFTSTTIADDRKAKKLSEDNNNLPVVYTGGNINLHVDGIDDKIKLVSYAIDFDDSTRDSKRHLRFNSSNNKYNPADEHKAYVNGVLSNLGVDVTLDINEDDDGSGTKYRYHNFNTMMSQFNVENTDTDSFKIYFKEGKVYTGSSDLNNYGENSQYDELVEDIVNEYNISKNEAKNMLEDSAMFKQLGDALENGNDPANSSHEVSGSGNEDYFSTDHWYDEQTSVLCVRKYVTYVSVGDVALSDKLDITLGDDNRTDQLQQKANRNELFSNAMFGKFYVSMYLKNDVDLADGNVADGTKYQVLWEEKPVNDSDFLISEATTNDMRN